MNSKYEFINELCESTLISNRQRLSKYTAKDIADLTFLYLLGLQILSQEFECVPFAQDYAKHTIQYGDFDQFRFSSTDLYVLLHVLTGTDTSAREELDNPEANAVFLDKLRISTNSIITWVRSVGNGKNNESTNRRFLLSVEQMLDISTSDYKSIRRLVAEWPSLNQQERSLAMTRLIFALRKRAIRSEILPVLEKLAKKNKLLIKDAVNPEEAEPKSTGIFKIAALAALAAGVIAGKGAMKLGDRIQSGRTNEDASVGSTSAGCIGMTPMPLSTEVKRRKKKSSDLDK